MAGSFLRGLGNFIKAVVIGPTPVAAPTPKPTVAVPSAAEIAGRKPAVSTVTIAIIAGAAVVAVGILAFVLKK